MSTSRKTIILTLIGSAILFAILEISVTWLASQMDQTWAALIATVTMLTVALILEKAFFGLRPLEALRGLGYRLWNPRAVLTASIIAIIMQAFFPIFSWVTGAQITLKSNWLWIFLGAIVLNGIGEETLFRGYIFGGLRTKAGLTFRQAGFVSMIIFAAVHMLLFIGNPPIIAILGLLIAIAAAFPMAYLFERGNNTIWAPALLHVATHVIRLVDIPEPHYLTGVSIWLVLQIGMVFLVYAFLGNLLKPRTMSGTRVRLVGETKD